MIEGIAQSSFDDPCGFIGQKPPLVLALKLRLAKEDRDHRGAGRHDVVAGHRGRAFCQADPLGVILEAARQRGAKAGFMGAAVRGGNGVAIGMHEAVVEGEPGHRPFERSVAALFFDLARENLVGDEVLALDILEKAVLEAAGKAENRLGRNPGIRARSIPARNASGSRHRRRDRLSPWPF